MLQAVVEQIKNTKAAQMLESKLAKTKGMLVEQTSAEANKALSWVVGKLVSDQLKGEGQDAVKAEIVSQIKNFNPRTLPEMIKPAQISLASLKELPAELKDLRTNVAKKLVESAKRSLEGKKTTKPAKEKAVATAKEATH